MSSGNIVIMRRNTELLRKLDVYLARITLKKLSPVQSLKMAKFNGGFYMSMHT